LSRAQTITFGSLAGSNGSAFTSYSEAGYNVNLLSGYICNAQLFGNPVPDLFGGTECNENSSTSVLSVTKVGGGLFRFLGLDANSQHESSTYTFAGYLASVSQYSTSGVLGASAVFGTMASPNTGTNIDEVRITFNSGPGQGSSYNVDNIQLGAANATVTPEPASFALMGLGLAVVAAVRRKRRA